jgi:tRNA(Ile)-lysidine synthase
MRTSLEQAFLQGIQRDRILVAGDRVGVAVSGGADSVALLRLFLRLRDDLGITLVVAHFNHLLRGAESEGDCEFVRDLALEHGLEIAIDQEDVGAAAEREGGNLEDTARRLRYAFFDRVVSEGLATRIAVAHTADDQAETVLSHLIRGTGLTGLRGIHPVAGVVLRPLLGVRREELRKYLRTIGQSWREDSTNLDTRRMRARIRSELLPMLQTKYSPTITEHLSELARFAREQEVFWDALVEDRFQALSRREGESVCIGAGDLLRPFGIDNNVTRGPASAKLRDSGTLRMLTERLVRRLYQEVRGNRKELGVRHVEQVIQLASGSNTSRRAELPHGIGVQRQFESLVFGAETGERALRKDRVAGTYEYLVNLPLRDTGNVSIAELGKCFRLKVIDWSNAESDTKGDANAIDADLLRSPLVLRNWRPGDAYRPRGRRHARKLKEIFAAGRIRVVDRATWPVLESDGRVVWSLGMPTAADYCVGPGTKRGMVIEEQAVEGLSAG